MNLSKNFWRSSRRNFGRIFRWRILLKQSMEELLTMFLAEILEEILDSLKEFQEAFLKTSLKQLQKEYIEKLPETPDGIFEENAEKSLKETQEEFLELFLKENREKLLRKCLVELKKKNIEKLKTTKKLSLEFLKEFLGNISGEIPETMAENPRSMPGGHAEGISGENYGGILLEPLRQSFIISYMQESLEEFLLE